MIKMMTAIGIAGVAPNVKIMPLKFIDAYGFGESEHAILAVEYAKVNGAKVINASWGKPRVGDVDSALQAAISASCGGSSGPDAQY